MDAGRSSNYTIQVYIGLWTDWSFDGAILGSTLTLTRSNANLLVAAIALYMTIVVGHLWAVCCFVLHLCFSRKGPQDAIYHQRQVILRNSSSPAGTAWSLHRMSWRWRKSSKSPRRILPFLGCLIALICGFTAATIFSSRVARGSDVLLDGTYCGRPLDGGDTEGDETLRETFY